MHQLISLLKRIMLYRASQTGSEPGLLIYSDSLRALESFDANNADQVEARNLLLTWKELWRGTAVYPDAQARLASWRENHEAIETFVLRITSNATETLPE